MQMDTKNELQKRAGLSLARAWGRLALRWPSDKLGPVPSIIVNRRLKVTAGRAFIELGKIDVSHDFMLDFPREILMVTIPHEAAHIAAYRIFGYGVARGEAHGKPWAMLMNDLGLPANIYHDMLEQRAIKRMAKRG